jgi:hypothetical protein
MLLFTAVAYTSCRKTDECAGMVCKNGGICNNGICKCPAGYEGNTCETKTDPCKNIACMNGGTCTGGQCKCPEGFTGQYCETDLCSLIDCFNGSSCIKGKCSCVKGYEGKNCETVTRNKFFGVWKNVSRNSNTTITISDGGDPDVSKANLVFSADTFTFQTMCEVLSTIALTGKGAKISGGEGVSNIIATFNGDAMVFRYDYANSCSSIKGITSEFTRQ